jgi:hypothetical protein
MLVASGSCPAHAPQVPGIGYSNNAAPLPPCTPPPPPIFHCHWVHQSPHPVFCHCLHPPCISGHTSGHAPPLLRFTRCSGRRRGAATTRPSPVVCVCVRSPTGHLSLFTHTLTCFPRLSLARILGPPSIGGRGPLPLVSPCPGSLVLLQSMSRLLSALFSGLSPLTHLLTSSCCLSLPRLLRPAPIIFTATGRTFAT